MLRNSVYNILRMIGQCLIVYVGVCEDLSGMGKIGVTSFHEISTPSITPITSDFPYFLNSRISRNPAEWQSALANVSGVVSFLSLDQDVIDRDVARSVITNVSYNTFDDLLCFCASTYCDEASRTVLSDLFKVAVLILRAIADETCYSNETVVRDLEKLVVEEFPARKQLILKSDFRLFEQVSTILDQASDQSQ